MRKLLLRNRLRINKDLSSFQSRKYFSPSCYAQSVVTLSALKAYLRGRCIDIGCGDMPFKELVRQQIIQYDSVDIEKRTPDVTYIADVQNMSVIESNTYDSALCLQVLEHVPDPVKALAEIHRILKTNAVMICSAPHLSRLHEEPHDYYRYTKYGLLHLFQKSGFRIISIEPTGGFFCFLGHQLSSLLLLPFWHIPVVRIIFFQINKWLIVKPCYLLDCVFDKRKIFALGYTCVVEKDPVEVGVSNLRPHT